MISLRPPRVRPQRGIPPNYKLHEARARDVKCCCKDPTLIPHAIPVQYGYSFCAPIPSRFRPARRDLQIGREVQNVRANLLCIEDIFGIPSSREETFLAKGSRAIIGREREIRR